MCFYFFFFFQAEDGIRDKLVTGVQTCALPISTRPPARRGRGHGTSSRPYPGSTASPSAREFQLSVLMRGCSSGARYRAPGNGTSAWSRATAVARCRRRGPPLPHGSCRGESGGTRDEIGRAHV